MDSIRGASRLLDVVGVEGLVSAVAEDEPIGLPSEALGDDPVTEAESPVPALAWVPYHDGYYHQIDGTAIAWTRRAVQIRWVDPFEKQQTVWVWAQAVTREDEHPR